jgi:pyridoxamine 5'-phosphate oxidase
MNPKIANIRENYSRKKLLEKKSAADPFTQFHQWWKDARRAKITEPNAMTLATSSPDGVPSARIVLLKGLEPEGFVFFTNYDSFKGQQLAGNPKACLVFFWKELERQVRITGLVNKLARRENEAYFQTRPRSSQIGAVISPQSQVIENRDWLESAFKSKKKETKDKKIECPPNWGGYVLSPVIVEFWQGRPGRLHDRLQYTLAEGGTWKLERLAP